MFTSAVTINNFPFADLPVRMPKPLEGLPKIFCSNNEQLINNSNMSNLPCRCWEWHRLHRSILWIMSEIAYLHFPYVATHRCSGCATHGESTKHKLATPLPLHCIHSVIRLSSNSVIWLRLISANKSQSTRNLRICHQQTHNRNIHQFMIVNIRNIWNILPLCIRTANNLSAFKSQLKTEFFHPSWT